MPLYREQYPASSRIRIKSRAFLEQFQGDWKFHHPLSKEQLDFAGVADIVKNAAFYHGGDVLYTLLNTPGTWHEECLESEI